MQRALAVVCLTLMGAVILLHAQINPLTGTWQGELKISQGAETRMILLITEENATLEAKVHISNQGPSLMVVDPIKRSGQTLDFGIQKLNGRFSGTIVGDHIKGTFTRNGTDIPLTLTRTARPAARPLAKAN